MVNTTMWRRPFAEDEAITLQHSGDAFSQTAARKPRQLARDTVLDRIGEIMPNPIPAHLCDPSSPRKVRLRPVGGGLEWTADPDGVELIGGDRP